MYVIERQEEDGVVKLERAFLLCMLLYNSREKFCEKMKSRFELFLFALA